MSSPSTRTLDHIVHITPPGTFHETAEQFRQLGFKSVCFSLTYFTLLTLPTRVIDGGTHAGGLTANSLVVRPPHNTIRKPYMFLIRKLPRSCPTAHT